MTSAPSPPKKKKKKKSLDLGWATVFNALILATGGIVGGLIGRATAPQQASSPQPQHSSRSPITQPIQFDVPQPARPGNPLPLVACTVKVQGSGSLSALYTLLIGNAEATSSNYFFQPVTWLQPGKWVSTIYVGVRADGGHHFSVIAVVMPEALAKYMVSVYQENNHSGAYLAGTGFPPYPAVVAAQELVQRKYVKTGC